MIWRTSQPNKAMRPAQTTLPLEVFSPWILAVLSLSLTLLLRPDVPAMPDTLSLLELSMLVRMLLELLRLLARRASSGSWGCNPLARAKTFKISVRLITPLSLPERLAPVIALAEIAGATAPVPARCVGAVVFTGAGPDSDTGSGVIGEGGTIWAGWSAGVEGPDEAGEGVSTTHIRCDRVATSLATVWARVLKGLTWKTGNESLPSFTPRSERMTEMKWMQEERRRGREVDFVSNCARSVASNMAWNDGAYSDVNVRDVADNVILRIEHWDRRYPLVVHQFQSCGQGLVAAVLCQSMIFTSRGDHLT